MARRRKARFSLRMCRICSQTQLDGIAHEQTIICRQLFAGHVVGSRPVKRKKSLLRMIITIIIRSKFLNLVITKYRDLSMSRISQINYLSKLRLWQIIDLLATDKSRYFAQPRLIIANCSRRLNFSVTYRAPNLTATSKSELDLDMGYFERVYGTFLIWLC